MRLTDLLDNLAPLSADAAATDISGLALNSTQVKKGDLFFALPGTARDGRDFIADAMTRGPSTIGPDAVAAEALRVMEERKITSLPVVDAAERRLAEIAAVQQEFSKKDFVGNFVLIRPQEGVAG